MQDVYCFPAVHQTEFRRDDWQTNKMTIIVLFYDFRHYKFGQERCKLDT